MPPEESKTSSRIIKKIASRNKGIKHNLPIKEGSKVETSFWASPPNSPRFVGRQVIAARNRRGRGNNEET